MKKTYFSILALSLLLALLTACGAQAKQPDEPTPAPQVTQTEAVIPAPAPEQPAEPPTEPAPEPIADIEPTTEPETVTDVEPEPEPEPEPAPENPLTFTDCNETVYATSSVNLRGGPSTEYDKVGSLSSGQSVTRIGIGTGDYSSWSQVQLADGSIVYVSSNYISTTKPVVQQQQTKPSGGGSTTTKSSGTTQSSTPSSTPSGGSSEQQWAESRGQGLAGLAGYVPPQGAFEEGAFEESESELARVNMN